MRVIGTAGHVDHGKSTLIEALTGVHPDRLKEERERQMTIDLGFGWMTLNSPDSGQSEDVGIVDVPGHRDFIENMLAGIGGIDAALFVVAADEGVMPQTREHLAILDILQIDSGVVALTKIDLVDDADWIDLVEADLIDVLHGTVLEEAPIVRLSAVNGEGLPELKRELSICLAKHPARPDLKRPRLPVDRIFSIAGFGTVVTGTLSDGYLNIGDEVEILPGGKRGRVRGLQTHQRKEDRAVPGSRTAVNLSGLSLDEIQRGDLLAHPGDYHSTQRLDVHFRLLADASQPLKHNTQVKLFIGASETIARLRLLGTDELKPGESGWLQLEPDSPVVAVRGDRYILRRPSPAETLGGGSVVDTHTQRRHKRFSAQTIERLEALSKGTPSDVLLQSLLVNDAVSLKELLARSNLESQHADAALQELSVKSLLINLSQPLHTESADYKTKDLIISKNLWQQIAASAQQEIAQYHSSYPLRRGIPKEELKSRLGKITRNNAQVVNACLTRLAQQGQLVESGPLIHLAQHSINFSPEQQRQIDQLMQQFAASPYSPPSIKDCQSQIGDEATNALIELGELVAVSPEVAFRKADYERMLADLRALFQEYETLTVAQARDHFQTSRRYALSFLEYLDSIGITTRKGDARILKAS